MLVCLCLGELPVQKKSPLILRPIPCLSYRTLNLLMNWFILLQVLVMVPKYAMRPTSLHCCRQTRGTVGKKKKKGINLEVQRGDSPEKVIITHHTIKLLVFGLILTQVITMSYLILSADLHSESRISRIYRIFSSTKWRMKPVLSFNI